MSGGDITYTAQQLAGGPRYSTGIKVRGAPRSARRMRRRPHDGWRR